MEKIEHEKNNLVKSQKSLYDRLKRVNKLFNIHFISLTLLLISALGFSVFKIYLLGTGQSSTELSQRYGLFGDIMTIIQFTALFIFIIQIGYQIYFYFIFIIRGNRALKQIKNDSYKHINLFEGIVPYITNFYAFFKRYSKEKSNLIRLVITFLFFNFIAGFFIIFLSAILLDTTNTILFIDILNVILFFSIMASWLINLITSFKIRNEIVKWEKLFPKLDEWAQEIEKFEENNSITLDDNEPS
jgi:hypothetical protein